jgi:hypothetical protein
VNGADYSVYLADCREIDEKDLGDEIEGEVVCDLDDGDYRVACYSPTSGLYSPWSTVQGGKDTIVSVPAFRHDIVVRFERI